MHRSYVLYQFSTYLNRLLRQHGQGCVVLFAMEDHIVYCYLYVRFLYILGGGGGHPGDTPGTPIPAEHAVCSYYQRTVEF
jgi:hypothetical protein